jgi:hypothetical protein
MICNLTFCFLFVSLGAFLYDFLGYSIQYITWIRLATTNNANFLYFPPLVPWVIEGCRSLRRKLMVVDH